MTSQYGLALDNVAAYELVLPNGTIKSVTQDDADLWFGLRVSKCLPGAGRSHAQFPISGGTQ
jgi:FAD/FMN-containing dehydrogenase